MNSFKNIWGKIPKGVKEFQLGIGIMGGVVGGLGEAIYSIVDDSKNFEKVESDISTTATAGVYCISKMAAHTTAGVVVGGAAALAWPVTLPASYYLLKDKNIF